MEAIDLFEIMCPIIEEYFGGTPELIDMYQTAIEAMNYGDHEMEACIGISDALDQAIERAKDQL
jgi:hypothetical protein